LSLPVIESIPVQPSARPRPFNVLVTGGNGFLGRHLVSELRADCATTSFDVRNPQDDPRWHEGSVTDADSIDLAMKGMDGLVIGHMAPRAPGVYDSAEIPFDINVKGTALLLDAAVRHGVKRVVLISSTATVQKFVNERAYLSLDLPLKPDAMYGLTKVLQEATARYYHQTHGLEIAVLRPAYITMGDSLEDKYGRRLPSVNWQFVDPRDIGQAALAALHLENLAFEVFYLLAGPDAELAADLAPTFKRLGWRPKYRFTEYPRD
jgi:nucleoside-diphosphate-sugar epimerase